MTRPSYRRHSLGLPAAIAAGALIAAVIYDGSVRNSVIIMATVGMAVTAVFLFRPLIAPGDLVHHPDELARD